MFELILLAYSSIYTKLFYEPVNEVCSHRRFFYFQHSFVNYDIYIWLFPRSTFILDYNRRVIVIFRWNKSIIKGWRQLLIFKVSQWENIGLPFFIYSKVFMLFSFEIISNRLIFQHFLSYSIFSWSEFNIQLEMNLFLRIVHHSHTNAYN